MQSKLLSKIKKKNLIKEAKLVINKLFGMNNPNPLN